MPLPPCSVVPLQPLSQPASIGGRPKDWDSCLPRLCERSGPNHPKHAWWRDLHFWQGNGPGIAAEAGYTPAVSSSAPSFCGKKSPSRSASGVKLPPTRAAPPSEHLKWARRVRELQGEWFREHRQFRPPLEKNTHNRSRTFGNIASANTTTTSLPKPVFGTPAYESSLGWRAADAEWAGMLRDQAAEIEQRSGKQDQDQQKYLKKRRASALQRLKDVQKKWRQNHAEWERRRRCAAQEEQDDDEDDEAADESDIGADALVAEEKAGSRRASGSTGTQETTAPPLPIKGRTPRPTPPDLDISGSEANSDVGESPMAGRYAVFDSPSSCLSSGSNQSQTVALGGPVSPSLGDHEKLETAARYGGPSQRTAKPIPSLGETNDTPKSMGSMSLVYEEEVSEETSTPTAVARSLGLSKDAILDQLDEMPAFRQVTRGRGPSFLMRRTTRSGNSSSKTRSRVNSDLFEGRLPEDTLGIFNTDCDLVSEVDVMTDTGTNGTTSKRSSYADGSRLRSGTTSKRNSLSVTVKHQPGNWNSEGKDRDSAIIEEGDEEQGDADTCRCGQPFEPDDTYCQHCRAERPMREGAEDSMSIDGKLSEATNSSANKRTRTLKALNSIAWNEWREDFPMDALNALAEFFEDCAADTAQGKRKASLASLQDCLGTTLGLLPAFVGTEAEARGLITTGATTSANSASNTDVVFSSLTSFLALVSDILAHAEKEEPSVLWPEADYQIVQDVYTTYAKSNYGLPMEHLFHALEALDIEELSTSDLEKQRWLAGITRTVLADRFKGPNHSGRQTIHHAIALTRHDFVQIATLAMRERGKECRREEFILEREAAQHAGFGPLEVEDLRELFNNFSSQEDVKPSSPMPSDNPRRSRSDLEPKRNNLARMALLFSGCGVRDLTNDEMAALKAILTQPLGAPVEDETSDGPGSPASVKGLRERDLALSTSLSREVSFDQFLLWMHEIFQQGIGDMSFQEQTVPTLQDLEGRKGFVASMLRERLSQTPTAKSRSSLASVFSIGAQSSSSGPRQYVPDPLDAGVRSLSDASRSAENTGPPSVSESRRTSSNSASGLTWAMRKGGRSKQSTPRGAAAGRINESVRKASSGNVTAGRSGARGGSRPGSRPGSRLASKILGNKPAAEAAGKKASPKGTPRRRGSAGSESSGGNTQPESDRGSGHGSGSGGRGSSASGRADDAAKSSGAPTEDSGVLLLTGLPPSEAMLARKAIRAISLDHTNAPPEGLEGLLSKLSGGEDRAMSSSKSPVASHKLGPLDFHQRLQMHMPKAPESSQKGMATRKVKEAQDAKTLVDHAMEKLARLSSVQDGDNTEKVEDEDDPFSRQTTD